MIKVGSRWEHKSTFRRYEVLEIKKELFDTIIKIRSETGKDFTVSDEKLKKDFELIK